jgi:hypothetical protein
MTHFVACARSSEDGSPPADTTKRIGVACDACSASVSKLRGCGAKLETPSSRAARTRKADTKRSGRRTCRMPDCGAPLWCYMKII